MARKKFSVGEIFEKENNKAAESEGNTVRTSEDKKVRRSEGEKVGKLEGRKVGIPESEKVGKSEGKKKDKKSFSIAKDVLNELKLLAWFLDKSDSAIVEVALKRCLSEHQEIIRKAKELREK